jgi:catechol 2,3-dioxygenase-like lactoylglutathione lyase family enzyme
MSKAQIDMKLEVVVIPVSDIDRAKRFYSNLGWRLDADFAGDGFRVIQFTPPGSASSIHFGTARPGVGSAAPGSAQGLYLIVSDIEAARAALAVNLPNYASAIVTTDEIVGLITSVQTSGITAR